jgi:hypothetical protein
MSADVMIDRRISPHLVSSNTQIALQLQEK